MTHSSSINHYQKKKLFLLLSLLTFICLLIGALRIQLTGNIKGLFLAWNLLLAWVPFLIAYFVSLQKQKISIIKLISILFFWLLFLPNAPYIITDLIHLRPRDGVPLWFDSIVIFIFAFHGLLLGITSTLFIHELLKKYLTNFKVWCILTGAFILSGYGIYLGRFLRWNSWDIIVNPIELLQDSFLKLTHPVAIVVTGIFALILFFSYLIFYQLIHLKTTTYDTKIV